MTSLAIETHGLGKRFGARAALESIDLEVPRGSAFGFLGRNGCCWASRSRRRAA